MKTGTNKMSMVQTILSLSSTSPEMSDHCHSQALQYLSVQLSIRDRNEITRVLCKSNPDQLTQAIRDGVAAYEPLIRQVHQAVNLSETVGDFQAFLNDMLKLCKPDKASNGEKQTPPTVEDFLSLLHTHQGASHKFLHQVTKNGKEISEWFRLWCRDISVNFRSGSESKSATANVYNDIAAAVNDLPKEKQEKVKSELDAYAKYIHELHEASASRVRDVMKNDLVNTAPETSPNGSRRPSLSRRSSSRSSSRSFRSIVSKSSRSSSKQASPRRQAGTMYGPGAYLARWQDLLDSTEIGPDKPFGEIRNGADTSVREESRKEVDGEKSDLGLSEKEKRRLERRGPKRPGVEVTVECLGDKFRELLMR